MRTTRSRLLTTLVLLMLAGLCTWSKSEAGSLVSRGGTTGTGSSVLVPDVQPTSGDPDTAGSGGQSVITQGSEGFAPMTPWWSRVLAVWARWGWVGLRVVGR